MIVKFILKFKNERKVGAVDGKVINVCSSRGKNDPNREIIYFQAVEELETNYVQKWNDSKKGYELEPIQKVRGYWFINQWGEKLSFHKDLKQLALWIADAWGSWIDFKILV